MLATTGVLRGLQDTRTPLVVAVVGNGLNVGLNLLLVYGVASWEGLGIAGSALGTVLAQLLSALALLAVVVRAGRASRASLAPDLPGIRAAARSSVALVIRTVTLRAALLVTTYAVTVGAADRAVSLATHQIAITLWTFLAFVLDAIAIAAQAMTGRYLGAGDVAGTRAVTRRMVQWGVASGVVCGVLLAAASPFLGPLFSSDPAVHTLLVPVLVVAALGQPVAGVVFVLDGVLIGAGDGRYLAWAGTVVLVVYAPVVLAAAYLTGELVAVWVAFSAVFMGARFVVLTLRARGDAWLVTGTVAAPTRR
jgi:putative MATE family efflux protein